jgi:hypothetical protein
MNHHYIIALQASAERGHPFPDANNYDEMIHFIKTVNAA